MVAAQENTAYVFAPADFSFTDPLDDPANNLQAVKITTLPSAGTLTDNGTAVSAGDFVSVSDINSGLLAFTPASNGTGAPYDNFTFQVQDDGGTTDGGIDTDPTPRTMTLNVMPSAFVNHAPVGTSNTVTTLENTGYAFTAADFGFSDPNDSPANNLRAVQITSLPSGGTLTVNGLALSAGDFIPLSAIDDGLLAYTPDLDAGGTAYDSLNFKVQDDGGTFNSGADTDTTARTMTLNVTIVNQAPAGTDNTVTTLENTPYVFSASDFGFTDPDDDPADNFAAVTIDSLPSFGTLTNNGVAVSEGDSISVSDINAGHLVFTPDANLSGTPYVGFLFQVQDDGGTTGGGVDTDHTFTAADFGFTDPADDPPNDFYRVKIVTLPSAGTLTNDGVAVSAGDFVSVSDIDDGKLVFTPATNAYGTAYANFTFAVQDDGGTANGGVDLDPTPRTMTLDVAPQMVTITSFSFSVWVYAGDTLSSVDYQITASAFGGTVYGSGTASVTLSGGTTVNWGFYQYTATVTGLTISVPVGTAWLELENAVTAQTNPAFWGENDGTSEAVSNVVGSMDSESFSIGGGSSTLYDNGSDPGTINAWTINFGYAVTNSFIVS